MNLKKNISLCLIIIWMIVIFVFSSMNGIQSNSTSKKVLKNVLEQTRIIEKEEITESKINLSTSKFNKIHYYFRKSLHFTEYFILSLLIINYLRYYKLHLIYKLLLTTVLSFLYSITDEVHQMFTFDRTPLFKDCLIDTSGAIVGCVLFSLIFMIYKNVESKKN